jgi:NH3-dependent NAD+ synthetase
MPVINGLGLLNNRIDAVRDFHNSCGVSKAELDLSGGIDSAIMAYIITRAIGPENLILVHTRINTNPEQTKRAESLAKALRAHFVNMNLTPYFENLVSGMLDEMSKTCSTLEIKERLAKDPAILGSIRSTLRAPVGRGFNRIFGGGIRHGTGNECEDRWLRFYQKGGDGEVDTNPIEMLSKTEVFQLAFTIAENHKGTELESLFRELISVKPSPDLWGLGDTHNDEDELERWTGVKFTYGRVHPETGAIISYGTIEQVSRLLDKTLPTRHSVEDLVFHSSVDTYQQSQRLILSLAYDGLGHHGIFTQETSDLYVKDLLAAARRVEFTTRHKSNNNIPTLGTRQELVNKGLITNRLF